MEQREWGKPVEGCALSISIAADEVPAGQGVELTLVFRNGGETQVTLPRITQWQDYALTVRRGLLRAPLTEFGKRELAVTPSGASAHFLDPGEQHATPLALEKLYDLTRPGRYTVRAAKTLPSPSGTGFITVVSNAISFEIVAEPATE